MQRKLTITIDEEIYRDLYQQVGRGKISRFIEDSVRPRLLTIAEMEADYKAMAADEESEREAFEWAEGLIEDAFQ